MDSERLSFIEESGLLFESTGLTRMSGRIFGYLMICDEDSVSFNKIMDMLHASKGSISTNLKLLANADLIEPVSLPGDRKTYYRLTRIHVGESLKSRLIIFKKFRELFLKGKQLKNRKDEVSEWLIEAFCFYKWFEDRIDEITIRWEAEKMEIMNEFKEKL